MTNYANGIPFSLVELIKDNYAYFDSYRKGFLYYVLHVKYIDPDIKEDHRNDPEVIERFTRLSKFQFTIPLDDLDGTVMAEEKAVNLLRWIRKAYESNELIRVR